MLASRTRPLLGLLLVSSLTGVSLDAAGSADRRVPGELTPLASALQRAEAAGAAARKSPEQVGVDRYALAGGCWALRTAATGRWVVRQGSGFAATGASAAQAEPFHFQAFDLGKYLLFGSRGDFLAAEAGTAGDASHQAVDTAAGHVRGTGDEALRPVREPALAGVTAADQAAQRAADSARGSGVVAAARPSGAAEWVARDAGNGTFALQLPVDDHDPALPGPVDPVVAGTLVAAADGALRVDGGAAVTDAARLALVPATGCAAWPEVQVNVTGTPAAAATPYEEARGYVDAHLHMMAFEFLGGRARCGRPWHPYGVAHALVDCPDHGPDGRGAVLDSALGGATPVEGHDPVGWPTFGYWPKYNSLTHEQVYYKWLERAWRGGLRMFTNLLVDNGVLCELYPYKKNSCNEMDGVLLQAERLRELERYVDAQSGGPGTGWFRIVTDPFEARRVVNAGKLAVVLGIEVSVPFDCGETLGIARCSAAQIDQWLDRVHALGVRQMELTNKFDNALTGVTGDANELGLVVNQGNRYETGHYWKMTTCTEPAGHGEHDHQHDKTQHNVSDASGGAIGRDAIFGAVLKAFGGSGAAPVYPAGPHCNEVGLSDLGRHALDGLVERGMIFDPDHMSAKARREALDYLTTEKDRYSGVVSSHSWADDPTYRRILSLGGVVTPHAGRSTSFVQSWSKLRDWADPRFVFGVGFGSDVNGLSTQGAPRNPGEANDVDYPFTGLGGVTVDRQVSGRQTYDVNTDGVDHYGLYPDWVEDVRLVAGARGDAVAADLARSVEAYLQMWERAIGVAPNACRADVPDLTKADLKQLRHGMTPEQVLAAVGQPDQRAGHEFSYCAQSGRVVVRFGADGRLDRLS